MSFTNVSELLYGTVSNRSLRNSELSSKIPIDEVLFRLIPAHSEENLPVPLKALFWGEGAGGISSFVAGWMAGRGMGVIVLDGANRFDPYIVSSFARSALIPPERLLKSIRIARAFTCYQMATLIGEKLPLLLEETPRKPWVILLGPITTFLDEDVPDKEAGSLFERALGKAGGMASGGISFLLFQPSIPSRSKRGYLLRRLFQFSDLVWRMDLDDEGPKVVVEKGSGLDIIENCKLKNDDAVKSRLTGENQCPVFL